MTCFTFNEENVFQILQQFCERKQQHKKYKYDKMFKTTEAETFGGNFFSIRGLWQVVIKKSPAS